MPRLFVAIRPPPPIRALLADLSHGVEGARWQDDEQLHLTLRFIGNVDVRTADDIIDALSAVRAPPFKVALSGVGSFEHKGRVDTLWAGVTPQEPLAALHRKIDHAVVRTGLPPEARTYRPHITLARGRMGPVGPFLAVNGTRTSPPFGVDHIALFESTLSAGGANYAVVERWPLR